MKIVQLNLENSTKPQKEVIPREELQILSKKKFEDRPMSPNTWDDQTLLLVSNCINPSTYFAHLLVHLAKLKTLLHTMYVMFLILRSKQKSGTNYVRDLSN